MSSSSSSKRHFLRAVILRRLQIRRRDQNTWGRWIDCFLKEKRFQSGLEGFERPALSQIARQRVPDHRGRRAERPCISLVTRARNHQLRRIRRWPKRSRRNPADEEFGQIGWLSRPAHIQRQKYSLNVTKW